jgi:hypothetical protein
MFKTFIAGILLGIAAAAAALYFVPVVDQFREHSFIVVHANQGNTESFHVNVPMDRIMVGAPAQNNPIPAGLDWPDDEQFADTRAELFKLRNGKDAVVGIASRISASDDDSGDIIEWVLHLPARGSAYIGMRPEAAQGGHRMGELKSGTREFAALRGQVSERWVADQSGSDSAAAGRIEILTAFVGTEVESE